MELIKDDSVNTCYGYYECSLCKSTFYGGGNASTLHEANCPNRPQEGGYAGCVYHVGPNCAEYDQVEER